MPVADDFIGVGGWVLNKIVEGFKFITEALASVGGWLKNRRGRGYHGPQGRQEPRQLGP